MNDLIRISITEPSKKKVHVPTAMWHEVETTPIEFYNYCLEGRNVCHVFNGHDGKFKACGIKDYGHFKQAQFLWVDIDGAPKDTNINFDTLTERLSKTKLCPTFVYETFSCGEKEKGYNACLRAVFVIDKPITGVRKYNELNRSISEYVFNLYPECSYLIGRGFVKSKVFDENPNASLAMNGTDGTRRRHIYYGNILNPNDVPIVDTTVKNPTVKKYYSKREMTVVFEDKDFENDTKALYDNFNENTVLEYSLKYWRLNVPEHTPYKLDNTKNYTVLPSNFKRVSLPPPNKIRNSHYMFIYGKQLLDIHPNIKPENMLFMLTMKNDSFKRYETEKMKTYKEVLEILNDIYTSPYEAKAKTKTIPIRSNSKEISYNQAVEEYKTDIINETFDPNLSENENYDRFIEKSVVSVTQATYHKRILKMGLSTPTAKKTKTVSKKIKPDITKYIDLTLSVRKNIEYIKEKYGIEVSRGTMHDTMKKMKTIGIINTKIS